ncbi:MAG: PTS sugar transporter subunit IIA [Erysipelotrichaceae bacterium]|nr:PTS sugar transporter subunit IIA [Erysipelotrichaceae bacterium]
MELIDVLDEKIIQIGVDAKDKAEALSKMSDVLLDQGYISDKNSFMEDIYFRESQGETGLGHGVAIPHGQSDSVNKLGIAIATLNQGIEWESLDDIPIDTIFLFSVCNSANFARDHMLMLSKVAAKLADDDLLERVRKASSAQEMVSLLCGD